MRHALCAMPFSKYRVGLSRWVREEMERKRYYAHSKEGEPPEHWQPLDEHLKNVAELARSFASDFNGGDWAYLAGLWRDRRNSAKNTN